MVILFGAEQFAGDKFSINFANPIKQAWLDATPKAELSLGIGFSFQPCQFSLVASLFEPV